MRKWLPPELSDAGKPASLVAERRSEGFRRRFEDAFECGAVHRAGEVPNAASWLWRVKKQSPDRIG